MGRSRRRVARTARRARRLPDRQPGGAQLGERDDDTRALLAGGFDRWEAHLRAGLAAMVHSGELRPGTDVDWLAASTLASLQGGLMLTQARRDPQTLRRALDGALALIGTYRETSLDAETPST